jgi:hypothetical protein
VSVCIGSLISLREGMRVFGLLVWNLGVLFSRKLFSELGLIDRGIFLFA